MKISKNYKKAFLSILLGCASLTFTISCKKANVATPEPVSEPPKAEEPQPVVIEEPKIEEPAPVIAEEPKIEEPAPVIEEPEPEPAPTEEPKIEEPSLVAEEPEVVNEEPPAPPPEIDDEYTRSVGDVAVDRDTFADDKEKVLKIISELDVIMKNTDYKSWLPYVENSSIEYWKLRKNLQKYEKRLPVKGIRLRELSDYFKFVFIPARKGREVNEIRYISDTYIKAVQVREEQEDLIYYYFNKINGKWKVHLPTNEELNQN